MKIGFQVIGEPAQFRFGLHAQLRPSCVPSLPSVRALDRCQNSGSAASVIQFNQAGLVFGDLKDNSARARCGTSVRRSAASDLQFVPLTFYYFPQKNNSFARPSALRCLLARGISHDYKSQPREQTEPRQPIAPARIKVSHRDTHTAHRATRECPSEYWQRFAAVRINRDRESIIRGTNHPAAIFDRPNYAPYPDAALQRRYVRTIHRSIS